MKIEYFEENRKFEKSAKLQLKKLVDGGENNYMYHNSCMKQK